MLCNGFAVINCKRIICVYGCCHVNVCVSVCACKKILNTNIRENRQSS